MKSLVTLVTFGQDATTFVATDYWKTMANSFISNSLHWQGKKSISTCREV